MHAGKGVKSYNSSFNQVKTAKNKPPTHSHSFIRRNNGWRRPQNALLKTEIKIETTQQNKIFSSHPRKSPSHHASKLADKARWPPRVPEIAQQS